MDLNKIASRIAAHVIEDGLILFGKDDVVRWVSEVLEVDPSSLNFTNITFEASGNFIGAKGGGESEGRTFYFSIHNRPYVADDEGVRFDPGTTQYPMEAFWED